MERIDHILSTLVTDNKKGSLADLDLDTVKNYTGDVIASLFELVKFWQGELDDKEIKILKKNSKEFPTLFGCQILRLN